MMRNVGRVRALALALVVLAAGCAERGPDLSKDPTLYVVGYAHLDTQWRWEYPEVIGSLIPATMHDNFALFEKYPNYVFNFSGANRYRMMKEYYPADFERVRQYVAAGRWFPSGSAMEESDVNVPSAESLIRQVLYGSRFFRREFGTTSAEYMLPDCFGFPASLPSILSHSGITGFSTQKLTWKSAAGIPFNVGVWEGLDGSSVIAALNPGSYGSDIREDLSASPYWIERIEEEGQRSGVFADYHYFGTGDRGGAPPEGSVALLEQIVDRGTAVLPPPDVPGRPRQEASDTATAVPVGNGPLRVISSSAEQMFRDIRPEQAAGLPRYQGDLLLIEHSAGSITSQAYMKRWNHANEKLADAAERASVAAAWLGGRPYPLERLNEAWTLVMGGQFHDILPGTSTPKAYEYSWNDELLALDQFAGVLTSAADAVAEGLDTDVQGVAIVVYNPLAIDREDVVESKVTFPHGVPAAVRVLGPDGQEVPAQLATVLFLAHAPSVGFAVYDVQPADVAATSTLAVTPSSLENDRYRLTLDRNGDVASVFDKDLDRELLSAPLRLALQHEKPAQWPAWNMDWADQQKPPRGYVTGPARVRVVENGPARVAVEVERGTEGSRFVQTIRLGAGDAGNRVEFANVVDWRIAETALKATFALTAANPMATYNWDVGTIQRGNNDSLKYEVPSHQWFDLTDASGEYGVTVLAGHKYGSDKPDDRTLRLTLIYTPGITGSYSDQGTQDWGRHEFIYGIAGHAGDWRAGRTDWQAQRLDQPLIAFQSTRHAGALGRSFSLIRLDTDAARVLAVKGAEDGDEVIVRVVELDGRGVPALRISLAGPIASAREVNGQELPVGRATVSEGALVTSLTPYQIRSFALTLGAGPGSVAPATTQPVTLAYDRSVASVDGAGGATGFDDAGRSLPAEMLPGEIAFGGVRFRLAPAVNGEPNAVTAHGQSVALPAGEFDRLYVLAASADGDRRVTFGVGDRSVPLTVQDWGGYIGQWDNRVWRQVELPTPPEPAASDSSREAQRARRIRAWVAANGPRTADEFSGTIVPGYVKPAPVAWFASHRHDANGANEPYAYAYLFAYAIDLPTGASTLTLPDDPAVRVLAVTVADEGGRVRPAQPLYDTLVRSVR
jgi:alpha-mannosidase